MVTQKGFAPILILVGILVLVTVAAGVYFLSNQNLLNNFLAKPNTQDVILIPVSQTPQATQASPTSSPDETADWKTFSSKFGYTFKYPNNITATIMSTSSDLPSLKEVVNIHFTDDSRSSFAGFNDWIYI